MAKWQWRERGGRPLAYPSDHLFDGRCSACGGDRESEGQEHYGSFCLACDKVAGEIDAAHPNGDHQYCDEEFDGECYAGHRGMTNAIRERRNIQSENFPDLAAKTHMHVANDHGILLSTPDGEPRLGPSDINDIHARIHAKPLMSKNRYGPFICGSCGTPCDSGYRTDSGWQHVDDQGYAVEGKIPTCKKLTPKYTYSEMTPNHQHEGDPRLPVGMDIKMPPPPPPYKTRQVVPHDCPSCDSSNTLGRYHRNGWREYTCTDCGHEFKTQKSKTASWPELAAAVAVNIGGAILCRNSHYNGIHSQPTPSAKGLRATCPWCWTDAIKGRPHPYPGGVMPEGGNARAGFSNVIDGVIKDLPAGEAVDKVFSRCKDCRDQDDNDPRGYRCDSCSNTGWNVRDKKKLLGARSQEALIKDIGHRLPVKPCPNLVDCPTCAGKGHLPCPRADAKFHDRDPDDPRGPLRNDERAATCNACHGSRRVNCPMCGAYNGPLPTGYDRPGRGGVGIAGKLHPQDCDIPGCDGHYTDSEAVKECINCGRGIIQNQGGGWMHGNWSPECNPRHVKGFGVELDACTNCGRELRWNPIKDYWGSPGNWYHTDKEFPGERRVNPKDNAIPCRVEIPNAEPKTKQKVMPDTTLPQAVPKTARVAHPVESVLRPGQCSRCHSPSIPWNKDTDPELRELCGSCTTTLRDYIVNPLSERCSNCGLTVFKPEGGEWFHSRTGEPECPWVLGRDPADPRGAEGTARVAKPAEKCSECGGMGGWTCEQCGGSGCSACSGYGTSFIHTNNDDPQRPGDPRYDKPCKCGGHGWVECHICEGDGKEPSGPDKARSIAAYSDLWCKNCDHHLAHHPGVFSEGVLQNSCGVDTSCTNCRMWKEHHPYGKRDGTVCEKYKRPRPCENFEPRTDNIHPEDLKEWDTIQSLNKIARHPFDPRGFTCRNCGDDIHAVQLGTRQAPGTSVHTLDGSPPPTMYAFVHTKGNGMVGIGNQYCPGQEDEHGSYPHEAMEAWPNEIDLPKEGHVWRPNFEDADPRGGRRLWDQTPVPEGDMAEFHMIQQHGMPNNRYEDWDPETIAKHYHIMHSLPADRQEEIIDHSIRGIEVGPRAMPYRPQARKIRFNPEEWHGDYALPAEPKGETTWTPSPGHIRHMVNTHGEDAFKPNDYPSDEWRHDPAAPQWVKDWDGPFYIEHIPDEGDPRFDRESRSFADPRGHRCRNCGEDIRINDMGLWEHEEVKNPAWGWNAMPCAPEFGTGKGAAPEGDVKYPADKSYFYEYLKSKNLAHRYDSMHPSNDPRGPQPGGTEEVDTLSADDIRQHFNNEHDQKIPERGPAAIRQSLWGFSNNDLTEDDAMRWMYDITHARASDRLGWAKVSDEPRAMRVWKHIEEKHPEEAEYWGQTPRVERDSQWWANIDYDHQTQHVDYEDNLVIHHEHKPGDELRWRFPNDPRGQTWEGSKKAHIDEYEWGDPRSDADDPETYNTGVERLVDWGNRPQLKLRNSLYPHVAHVGDDAAVHHSNPQQFRVEHPYFDDCVDCSAMGLDVNAKPCKTCGGLGESWDQEYWDGPEAKFMDDFANYPNIRQVNPDTKFLDDHIKGQHGVAEYDDPYSAHTKAHGLGNTIDPETAKIIFPELRDK